MDSLFASLLSEAIKNIVKYFRGEKKNIFLIGMERSGKSCFYDRLKTKSTLDKRNKCLKMKSHNTEYSIKLLKYKEDIPDALKAEDAIVFFMFDIYLYMCDTLYRLKTNSLLDYIYRNSHTNNDFQVVLMGTHINEFFQKVLSNRAFAAGILSDLPYNTAEEKKYFQDRLFKYRKEEEDFRNNTSNEVLKQKLKDSFFALLRGKEYQKVSDDLIPINTNRKEEIDFIINELL
ncbi:MAG: hypothetical protein PUC50_17165 [Bacteroidales bacterium]|nr:hypothetical protein [Bacteroidales bacterium]